MISVLYFLAHRMACTYSAVYGGPLSPSTTIDHSYMMAEFLNAMSTWLTWTSHAKPLQLRPTMPSRSRGLKDEAFVSLKEDGMYLQAILADGE